MPDPHALWKAYNGTDRDSDSDSDSDREMAMPNEAAASRNTEERLRAIEDRLEIYNLIASHPPSADTGAADYARSVYTEDGVIDLGGAKTASGRDAIAAMLGVPGHQAAIVRISPGCRTSRSTTTARWSRRICRS
jgi:hypothetical protein